MRCIMDIIILVRILLCGVGNKDRGDDGFGPYIVENFTETADIKKINCTLYPENYLNKMVSLKPDLIIFFDAVKYGGADTILLRDEEITENSPISVSTHNLPFSSMYQYLKENTKAHIWFVGIKPSSYEQLTEKTLTLANHIIKNFNLLDKQKNLNIINIYETVSTTLK